MIYENELGFEGYGEARGDRRDLSALITRKLRPLPFYTNIWHKQDANIDR